MVLCEEKLRRLLGEDIPALQVLEETSSTNALLKTSRWLCLQCQPHLLIQPHLLPHFCAHTRTGFSSLKISGCFTLPAMPFLNLFYLDWSSSPSQSAEKILRYPSLLPS